MCTRAGLHTSDAGASILHAGGCDVLLALQRRFEVECVPSLLAMSRSVALPTLHLQVPDPACDLDYVPNAVREGVAVRTMLSNSFAFGGTNAVLALRATTPSAASAQAGMALAAATLSVT